MLALLADQYAYFKEQADTLQDMQQRYQDRVQALERTAAQQAALQEVAKKTAAKKIEKKLVHKKKKQRRTRRMRRMRGRRCAQQAVGSHIACGERAEQRKPSQQCPRQDERLRLAWPVAKGHFWISSHFGQRRIGNAPNFHSGLDMAAVKGTPVKAADDGVALEATASNGYGNTILLQHAHGVKTRYAHMHRLRIKPGQSVKRGKIIGTVGNTGNVRANGNDGSHLHFEVIINGQPRNPLAYLG